MIEAPALQDAPAASAATMPGNPEPSQTVKRRRGKGVPFTPDLARAASLKAVELARKRKADAEEIARIVALTPKLLANERAELCAQEIKRTHKALMEEELSPKDRAQLLTALDRLLERERVLRGIPNPGSYRPTKPKNPQEQTSAQPVD